MEITAATPFSGPAWHLAVAARMFAVAVIPGVVAGISDPSPDIT